MRPKAPRNKTCFTCNKATYGYQCIRCHTIKSKRRKKDMEIKK